MIPDICLFLQIDDTFAINLAEDLTIKPLAPPPFLVSWHSIGIHITIMHHNVAGYHILTLKGAKLFACTNVLLCASEHFEQICFFVHFFENLPFP